MQAYDAAQLIDAALTATGGSTDKAKLDAAIHEAKIDSPRGNFRLNTNGYPIQDFYLTKVGKRPDGLYETQIVQKIFTNNADDFAKDCPQH
jgi:branched-chain amino acid transport system substrate-binding protein